MAKAKSFADESKQAFGPDTNGLQSVDYAQLKIGEAGRIVIPAGMRAAMMVKPGDTVTARVVDGEFRIVSPAVAVHRAQALARELLHPSVSLVDELIADRRAEARREADETGEWRKAHGLPALY